MVRHFTIKKLADVEALLPGFRKMWPALKDACHSSQRCPRSITFTDESRPLYLNDGEWAKRFALDLRDMSLSESVHASAGEWAIHGGSNNDRPVVGIPSTHALLTCVVHEYYRSFAVEVQVAALPQALPEAS